MAVNVVLGLGECVHVPIVRRFEHPSAEVSDCMSLTACQGMLTGCTLLS
jgi:hypothetical protein